MTKEEVAELCFKIARTVTGWGEGKPIAYAYDKGR